MKLTYLWFALLAASDSLNAVVANGADNNSNNNNNVNPINRQRQTTATTMTNTNERQAVLNFRHTDDQGDEDHHRELQRVASICSDAPTPFATSLYITHIGDGTPFTRTDLDELLRLTIQTYNGASANQCDPAYRSLSRVSVADIYYTDSLDYIRLRYDVEGACEGCLVAADQMVNGIGPLFGAAEQQSPTGGRMLISSSTSNRSPRRIKGRQNGRELKQDKNTGKQQNRVCGCSNNALAEADQRGPTSEELGIALNAAIQQSRSAGTLSGVASVEEIFEAGVVGTSTVSAVTNDAGQGQPIACTVADNQDFTTIVSLEVFGSELVEGDVLPVEVAIMETFNEMNLVTCDSPFFRKVSDVSYEGTRASGSNGSLLMTFEVKGICVNCDPATMTLLTIGSGSVVANSATGAVMVEILAPDREFRPPARSLLISEIERLEIAQNAAVMVIREVEATCACPLNQADLALRSPTESEFLTTLGATLEILSAELLQSSIRQIVGLVEGEIEVVAAVCPGEATEWVTSVYADFEGKPSLLQSGEIAALESGFIDNYNELIFDGCDEYFRSIEQVTLVPGRSKRRSLQGSSTGSAVNSTDVVDLQSELPSVYMVSGTCRNCPVTQSGTFNMFDDAFRLRNLMELGDRESIRSHYHAQISEVKSVAEFMSFMSLSSIDAKQHRQLQQNCACAPGTTSSEPFAPTAAVFTDAYNVRITDFRNQGLVTNINSVLDLQEVLPSFVVIGFSIFYGSLERVGTPTVADLDQLALETAEFYRPQLEGVYGASLLSVQVNWLDTFARVDLDRLQVGFAAELTFDGASIDALPTKNEVTMVMANFNYVDYITDYVWGMQSPASDNKAPAMNAFGSAHTVLFTGTEDVVVEVPITFTLRAGNGRTIGVPSSDDVRGLTQEINMFFKQTLSKKGFLVVSFNSNIRAEEIKFDSNGRLVTDIDARVIFSKEATPPTPAELKAAIRTANLNDFRTALDATGYFGEAQQITFGA